MKKYFLILILLLPTLGLAKMADDTGLLKHVNQAALEKIIHQKLIDDVKVVNSVYQVIDGMHSHRAIPGCTKQIRHKHKARKNHYHKYSCLYARRYMARRAAPRAAKAKASSTNVQEQGVDEADYVKTDGRYLYAVQPYSNGGIRIYDTQYKGKQLKQLGAIGFGKNTMVSGIYLSASQKQLIAITQTNNYYRYRRVNGGKIGVITVDIRQPNKPKIISRVLIDGSLDSSRRINNMLYLVSKKGLNLPSTYKSIESSKPLPKAVMAKHRQNLIAEIKKWRIKDHLPKYRIQGKGGAHVVIKDDDLYYNPKNPSAYSLTSIVAINLAKKMPKIKGLGWLGNDYGIDYFSKKALYISSADYGNFNKNSRYPSRVVKTLIHKFAYHNTGFDYRGSGYVLGQFGWRRNSTFQLDEDKKGNLRVVTNNPQASVYRKKNAADPVLKSPVVLTSLAENPHKKALMILDNLPNKRYPKALGKPREQLYGARLFEDYAYFVTFRRTDPLYVVDMRNPQHLKLSGELVIPGFSDYLHPLGKGLLLGVGKDAVANKGAWVQTKGIKLSLFDIRNPRQPKEINKVIIGKEWSQSEATDNHHAFTYLQYNDRITRVAIPIDAYDPNNPHIYSKGLYRFEIDRYKKKITNLGKMKALNNQSWSWNDRSIMIGERLYYYHNGHFTVGNWKD